MNIINKQRGTGERNCVTRISQHRCIFILRFERCLHQFECIKFRARQIDGEYMVPVQYVRVRALRWFIYVYVYSVKWSCDMI